MLKTKLQYKRDHAILNDHCCNEPLRKRKTLMNKGNYYGDEYQDCCRDTLFETISLYSLIRKRLRLSFIFLLNRRLKITTPLYKLTWRRFIILSFSDLNFSTLPLLTVSLQNIIIQILAKPTFLALTIYFIFLKASLTCITKVSLICNSFSKVFANSQLMTMHNKIDNKDGLQLELT